MSCDVSTQAFPTLLPSTLLIFHFPCTRAEPRLVLKDFSYICHPFFMTVHCKCVYVHVHVAMCTIHNCAICHCKPILPLEKW